MNLSDNEVNKIIAEYMDSYEYILQGIDPQGNEYGVHDYPEYTKSLDALVPVWEKLQIDVEFDICKDDYRATICHQDGYIYHRCENLKQAAAYATAKAIMALK